MPKHISYDVLNKASKELNYCRRKRLLFKKLVNETHFNFLEVKALALIHYKIRRELGLFTRVQFRNVLHAGFDLTENIRHILVNKVFDVMVHERSSYMNMENWIRGLSIMLRGSLEEKAKFAYEVYDIRGNGKIRREQIFRNMRGCLICLDPDEEPDEIMREFADMIFRFLNIDRDRKIIEEEFKKVVMEKNELLLECMGPIFPSRDTRYAFLTTFTDNIGHF